MPARSDWRRMMLLWSRSAPGLEVGAALAVATLVLQAHDVGVPPFTDSSMSSTRIWRAGGAKLLSLPWSVSLVVVKEVGWERGGVGRSATGTQFLLHAPDHAQAQIAGRLMRRAHAAPASSSALMWARLITPLVCLPLEHMHRRSRQRPWQDALLAQRLHALGTERSSRQR